MEELEALEDICSISADAEYATLLFVDLEDSVNRPSSLGEEGTERVEVGESGVETPDNIS